MAKGGYMNEVELPDLSNYFLRHMIDMDGWRRNQDDLYDKEMQNLAKIMNGRYYKENFGYADDKKVGIDIKKITGTNFYYNQEKYREPTHYIETTIVDSPIPSRIGQKGQLSIGVLHQIFTDQSPVSEAINYKMADGGIMAKGGDIEIISKEDVKKLYDRYKYLENLDEQGGGNTGFKNQYKNVINEIENKYVKKIIENSKYEDLKNMYGKKLNFTRFSTKKLGLSLITFSKYWMNSGGWKIERLSDEEKDKVIKELKKLFPGIIIEKPVFNTTEYSYGVEKYEYIYMVINFDKYAKGGQMDKKPAKFKDKVKAISKSLEGKKVPKRVRKDYGATYDKKESMDAAKRIAGSMAKKERKRYEI
jgi:hypothetical protein